MEQTDITWMTPVLGIRVVAPGLDANFLPTKMADVAAPTAGFRLTAAVLSTGRDRGS